MRFGTDFKLGIFLQVLKGYICRVFKFKVFSLIAIIYFFLIQSWVADIINLVLFKNKFPLASHSDSLDILRVSYQDLRLVLRGHIGRHVSLGVLKGRPHACHLFLNLFAHLKTGKGLTVWR